MMIHEMTYRGGFMGLEICQGLTQKRQTEAHARWKIHLSSLPFFAAPLDHKVAIEEKYE
jgi:hypothetical protein